jgi:hypothetical protein
MLLYCDKLNELFEKIMNLEHFVGIVKKSVQEMDDEISASERECVSCFFPRSPCRFLLRSFSVDECSSAISTLSLGDICSEDDDSCGMCDGDGCMITNGPRLFEIGVCSLQ